MFAVGVGGYKSLDLSINEIQHGGYRADGGAVQPGHCAGSAQEGACIDSESFNFSFHSASSGGHKDQLTYDRSVSKISTSVNRLSIIHICL